MRTREMGHIITYAVICLAVLGASGVSQAETLTIDSTQHISPNGVLSSPLQSGQTYWIEVSGTWMRDSIHWCDAEWYEPEPNEPWVEEYAGYPGLLDLQIDEESPNWCGYVNGLWRYQKYSPDHRYGLPWTGAGEPLLFSIYDIGGENSGTLTVTITAIPQSETLVIDSTEHVSPDGVESAPLQAGHTYWIEAAGTWLRDSIHQCDAEWYEPEPNQPWEEEYPAYPGLLDLQINQVSPDWHGYVNGLWLLHAFSPEHRYGVPWTGAGDPLLFGIYDLGEENSGALTVTVTRWRSTDLNHDGEIGLEDLAQLLSNYGCQDCSLTQGDFTGDGLIGLDDLAQLLSEYGAFYPPFDS